MHYGNKVAGLYLGQPSPQEAAETRGCTPPNNCIAPVTDNTDVKLFIVDDESIEPGRALSLVLGELIPAAGLAVRFFFFFFFLY